MVNLPFSKVVIFPTPAPIEIAVAVDEQKMFCFQWHHASHQLVVRHSVWKRVWSIKQNNVLWLRHYNQIWSCLRVWKNTGGKIMRETHWFLKRSDCLCLRIREFRSCVLRKCHRSFILLPRLLFSHNGVSVSHKTLLRQPFVSRRFRF